MRVEDGDQVSVWVLNKMAFACVRVRPPSKEGSFTVILKDLWLFFVLK